MISRVEALYYRSLRYVAQDVRAFQVLVGPNASGKSTFLDVIALLGDFVRYGLDGALLFGTESGRGRASRFEELVFNQQHDYVELALEFAVPAALRQPVGEHGSSTMYDRARYEVAFGLADTGDSGPSAQPPAGLCRLGGPSEDDPPRSDQCLGS
ncbi:AAA family ATPase [Candidatus Chloroploca sp. Khr17]|uniref:AAA family ATPase n=1 Tax=Candidatus Chloroploca sp. Khr17 TaxID=2496869 RepID=UPI00196AE464|nr:AAA family ATPase [Candidatus Chloroploca sp. Khr17]